MNARHLVKSLLVLLGVLAAAVAGCGSSGRSGENPTLTVYSANGLGAWYNSQFEKFTDETGIKVTLFEAGSGELVSRLNSGAVWERLNADGKSVPPADLLVTLPPFIQKAEKAGLLQPSGADTNGIPVELIGPAGSYVPIVKTALCFIANRGVDPKPATWQDLLAPRFKGKLQYSTPGEAGDGTAVLLLLQHLMGKQGALDYLAKLQPNNVGPASSTSSLQPKVDSGELLVANGDVQMNLAAINNDGSKFDVFFPAMPDKTRTTISLPYVAGVTAAAKWPEEAKKLLAFLLSDQAQKDVYSTAFGIPVRNTVTLNEPDQANTPTGTLKGVTLWAPDWNAVLADLETDLADYKKAIG
jgi:2-aminoethylphosphonate transport system substrate-binding protein